MPKNSLNPNPSVHYPLIPPALNGGAMSGFRDYGPFSWPRYTDIDLFKMKDGEPVQSREDWWIKCPPEIFKLVIFRVHSVEIGAPSRVQYHLLQLTEACHRMR